MAYGFKKVQMDFCLDSNRTMLSNHNKVDHISKRYTNQCKWCHLVYESRDNYCNRQQQQGRTCNYFHSLKVGTGTCNGTENYC